MIPNELKTYIQQLVKEELNSIKQSISELNNKVDDNTKRLDTEIKILKEGDRI